MKRNMSIWVVIASVTFALLFIAPAFQVGNASQPTSQVSVNDGFSFPYSYYQPSVPSSAGAQGIQGPTVSLTQIGVQGQGGSSGNLGPASSKNPYGLTGKDSQLTLHVFNGTASSSSPSKMANVYLVNVTTGKNFTAVTNSLGSVQMTITDGWYYLKITPAVLGTEINFEQQTLIHTGNVTLTRYLPQASNALISVANGDGRGSIWFTEDTSVGPISQLRVSLLNSSSSGAVIASGITGNNGSVEFTSVGTTYSYSFNVNGITDPLTNVDYYMTNYTTGESVFSASNTLVVTDSGMYGQSKTTASGVVLPSGNYRWNITTPITINGGITYISSPLSWSSGSSLSFVNSVVYFNESISAIGTPTFISFTNSTVYFISETASALTAQRYAPLIRVTHSELYGIANTNLPISQEGLMLGFRNISYSVLYCLNTNYKGAFYGSFYQDTILNSSFFGISVGNASTASANSFYFDPHTNMTSVSIVNSELTGGTVQLGTINFTRTAFSNSTTFFSAYSVDCYYLNLNITIPATGAQINSHIWNMYHSELKFSAPQNETFVQYAQSLPPNSYPVSLGRGPYVSFTWDPTGSAGYGVANFTLSYLTWGFPEVNVTPVFGGFNGISQFYNCYFYYNLTQSQLASSIASYHNNFSLNTYGTSVPTTKGTTPFYANRINWQFRGPNFINYTEMNFGDYAFMLVYAHRNGVAYATSYFSHDVFPYKAIMQDVYSYFRLFPGSPAGAVEFSNDTFGYIYFNWTNWLPGNNQEGFASIWMETATSEVFSPPPYINITHDTFDAPSFGAGGNGMAGIIQFAKVSVIGEVSNCKFLNSPSYVILPTGVSNSYANWYLPPHQDDILATAADVTIHDNWFLNLTNLTMPFGTDQAYQNGGYGGNVTAYSNHFFYYPLPGMTFINETWGFSNVGYYGNSVPIYNGAYNGSHLSYEIPMGLSATMKTQSGGAYIYNSSIEQTPPSSYVFNVRNYVAGQPSQYSWIIEPNFVWNGSTYVAQDQGMSGPQPNLSYRGYSYNWAFEQNMTYISTSSSSAATIPLRWSIPNPSGASGTLSLYLHNFTSGANQKLRSVALDKYSTNVSYEYRPWVDGLTAIYFLNYSLTSLPPNGNQLYPVSFHESGLPSGTKWAVSLSSHQVTSNSDTIVFNEQNGSYTYNISSASGWIPNVSTGDITVAGKSTSVDVSFSQNTYVVSFVESGLSNGANWTVSLGNFSQGSTSSVISFNEPNNSYQYSIGGPGNYSITPSTGSIEVNGSSVNVAISFTPNASLPTNTTTQKHQTNPVLFEILGFKLTYLSLTLVVVVGVAVVASIYLLTRKHKPR